MCLSSLLCAAFVLRCQTGGDRLELLASTLSGYLGPDCNPSLHEACKSGARLDVGFQLWTGGEEQLLQVHMNSGIADMRAGDDEKPLVVDPNSVTTCTEDSAEIAQGPVVVNSAFASFGVERGCDDLIRDVPSLPFQNSRPKMTHRHRRAMKIRRCRQWKALGPSQRERGHGELMQFYPGRDPACLVSDRTDTGSMETQFGNERKSVVDDMNSVITGKMASAEIGADV
ncbi:hypothetical protein PI125_g14999 [Phytophthora idaei]|nr:hypothetical protein PI125_g14999 [Phytophthora idaei]KAG3144674.1 hypothetical protein PI126_g14067 [Phytophthora idaei]